MARSPGHLALLLMKAHDPKAEGGDGADIQKRQEAAQGILDAIDAKDAGALDAALADWCHEYEETEGEYGDDGEPKSEG